QIILMSASINSKELADYFALPVQYGVNPVCVFKVEGRPFAIEEYYLDDLKDIFDFQLYPQSLGDPAIKRKMYEVAVCLIQSFDEFEKRSNREKKNWGDILERGSVLVFLPGLGEIRYMHSCLSDKYQRWQVYPLHACATLEEQSKVFSATVPGYRKVILATNVAESSVTVPDVKYGKLSKSCNSVYSVVFFIEIFSMLVPGLVSRIYHCSKHCCWICHASHEERVTIVLSSLQHCPLGTTVLKLKKLDIGEPKALLATALSPPSPDDIECTIVQLKELGALTTCVQTEENRHDGELTFLGMVLTELPVDLHLGKLIVLGHVFGCLEECLIIAAALSLRSFFAVPFKKHVDAYRKKMFFAGNSRSDFIAILNAFRAWQACKEKGKLR
ncbi:TDRD9 helicase, partial [Catharus fuscescens]|nr:TDRD9 helicase [Catharus fuscescens]